MVCNFKLGWTKWSFKGWKQLENLTVAITNFISVRRLIKNQYDVSYVVTSHEVFVELLLKLQHIADSEESHRREWLWLHLGHTLHSGTWSSLECYCRGTSCTHEPHLWWLCTRRDCTWSTAQSVRFHQLDMAGSCSQQIKTRWLHTKNRMVLAA